MELKAAGVLSTIATIDELHGRDVLAAALDHTGPTFAALVRNKRLLPSTWIGVADYARLLEGFTAQGFADDAVRTLGRVSTTRDVNTIYRLVFRALSPELVAKQAPRLFSIYYRGGEITVLDASRTSSRVQYRRCEGFTRWVWLDYLAGSEAVLRLTGAKDVAVTVESGGTGAEMIAAVRWS